MPTSSASGVEVEHPPGGLPGADAEFENPLGLDTGGRLGDGALQPVVRRHLSTDRLEVGGRVEVELVTVESVSHGRSLAGGQQPLGMRSRGRSIVRVVRDGRRFAGLHRVGVSDT